MTTPAPTEGIVCALWTPTNESGNVDFGSLDRHLEFLLQTGISGIMALGSTGRFPEFGPECREELLIHILKRTGSLPVVANVSDLDIRVVERLAAVARDHGAAAVSMLPPWYYEMSQSDMVEWFVRGGDATELPLWLYNFPERTGNKIEVHTVSEVCARTNVGGFKQSGANQAFMTELAELALERPISIFAGADDLIQESLNLRAVGCISGLANALPEPMVKVFEAAKSGMKDSVAVEQELLTNVVRRFHLIPFPWNQAAIMQARGLDVGTLPRTMSRISRAHFEQLTKETLAMIDSAGVVRLS